MRAICIAIAVLGLLLSGYSAFEIANARKYRVEVEEVRRLVLELDRLHTPKGATRLQVPSVESMLEPLDAAARFEQSWWRVAIAGTVVFVTAIVGLVIHFRTHDG